MKTPKSSHHRARRICAIPFAALYAVSGYGASSWTSGTDAVWSTGGDWIGGTLPVVADVAVFDASSVTDLNVTIGLDASVEGVKVTTPEGLITIGGVNVLTLCGGALEMSGGMNVAIALTVEQSRNAVPALTVPMNGVTSGAAVNLSRIENGGVTLNSANTMAKTAVAEEEQMKMSVAKKVAGVGDFAFANFRPLSIGAAPRVKAKLEAVRFDGARGVAGVARNGGRRVVEVSTRNAGASEKAENTSEAAVDFAAALRLQNGAGPMVGIAELGLVETGIGNADGSNLTLGAASIATTENQSSGRQYVTTRLLPLVSPPAVQGTYAINFHGAYQAANADVTGTLGPGLANQANWINTSSGVDVNGGPGIWTWTATDSNLANPIGFRFAHTNAGGEDGGGGGATDFARLFNTGERTNDGTFTITSTTAIPFSLYDIFIYGPAGGYTVNGSNVVTPFTNVDGFTSGGNTRLYYGKSGPLTINGGSINGFSIVPVGPPAVAYWKGTTSGVWNASVNNFTTDLAGTNPIRVAVASVTDVIFNANGAANFATTTLGADTTIKSLTFGSNATAAVGIGGGNTLTITPDTASSGVTVASLSGNHTISTKVALGAAQTWTVADAGQILNASGEISGAASLTKAGAGTLVLTGNNTYTGATNVNDGTLSIGNGTALPALATSGITLANNSKVAFNHSDTVTYGNAIAGSGSFTKSGSGTLTLTAVQTYDGATLIDGGTLKLHSDLGYRYYRFSIYSLINSDLAQMSELAFYSSGTNNINGTRVIPTAAAGDGGNYGDQLIPALSDNNQNTKCTYNGLPNNTQYGRYITFDFGVTSVLTGYDWRTANDQTPNRNPNNFSLFGSNDSTNFTLVNAQTNAGSVPITTFTWAPGWATGLVSNQNLLPITTNVTITNGGTLSLDGANQQIASLAGASGTSVTNSGTNDRTLTINGSTTTTFSGVISNGATNKITLTKEGSGTQILAGANTYTGATTINAGMLQLGDGGTTGSISLLSSITDNGTFAVNRSNTTAQDVDFGPITGSGGFTQAGSGTTILSLVNTYTGVTTVDAGTLVVNGTISGSATTVNNGGTLAGNNNTGAMGNVTVNSGGTFAPGGSATGTLNTGTLTFAAGSVFNFQIDTSTPAIDIVSVTGDLNITSGAIFNASDLANVVLPEGTPVPAIIDYNGTWNGGTFVGLADDSIFMIGANAYQISYNGLDGASSEVTLSVVPEPGTAVSLLGGLGLLLGVRRRRA